MANADRIREVSIPSELSKYTLKHLVGMGTFGLVFRVCEKETGQTMVMKFGTTRSLENGDITLSKEIIMLSTLREENRRIIRLVEFLQLEGRAILVLEECVQDLHVLMNTNALYEMEKKTITKHILEGVSYLEQKDIIHCDLTPWNILLSREGYMKICDFGSARTTIRQEKGYITWPYASIELLLGVQTIDFKTDTWAVGCICAELQTERPLFEDQGTLNTQIEEVFDLCGTLRRDAWNSLWEIPMDNHYRERDSTIDIYVTENVEEVNARELIFGLLLIDRRNRWSSTQALNSEYMRSNAIPDNVRQLIPRRRPELEALHD